MKIQMGAISVALVVLAMTIPAVRSTVFAAVPTIEQNDNCGKIVCGESNGQGRKSSPDIKFNPN
jgi:hypothetical protein